MTAQCYNGDAPAADLPGRPNGGAEITPRHYRGASDAHSSRGPVNQHSGLGHTLQAAAGDLTGGRAAHAARFPA